MLSQSEKQLNEQPPEQQQPEKVKEAVRTAKEILVYIDEATTQETRTQAIINDVVKPLYTIASASLDPKCLKKVTDSQFAAIANSADVSLHVIEVDNATDAAAAKKALDAVNAAKLQVISYATMMVSQVRACSAANKKPQAKGPPQYDPIDLISETVNFFVTGSGSITPGWKLVKVTAPLAPTLLSGMRKDTNTLILVMGRPAPAPGGGLTSSSAMNNQILAAILSQAVTARPLVSQ